ncbi:AAA family ATPase [Halobacillus sp. A1]|uniref:ATP-dependent nuclease n=1 Tax=Halobacillus sp. A1 TaxID=2880262 RepID=UPI0020A682E4|nr:AAA family ATPase [Halobacillus sp. A1]MCP3032585.1 AAA family ATPase [Halobacillus sp. A1]
MYIHDLTINNYRSFESDTTITFNSGTNVIIGQNNAGKTTVIKALELLFNPKKNKRLTIDDFNKNIPISSLQQSPPSITISATIKESPNEYEYSDDLVTVSTWLTKLGTPYEAKITYEFFLPEKEWEEYFTALKKLELKSNHDLWNEIENNFLRKYIHKIYIGDPEFKNSVETETINKFDFQFLTAIRDVERDLFTGRNALLKEVIDFFMDYEIKVDDSLERDEKNAQIRDRKRDFSREADKLIQSLQKRMDSGKDQMLRYVQNTGASMGEMQPKFEGTILDTELYSALKLIVESETGMKLPAVNNGLGYNNLIYISLLLAKMQKDSSGEYLGSNSKVYSILAIEEPEAHLHPSMQYKFLKFLKQNRETEVRQVFITSHSSNITAAVDIDDIIVLYNDDDEMKVSYPGRVFDEGSLEDIKSKRYIQRFLDVTKADLFFAQNVILVEGLAEQLLIPEFAIGLGEDLIDTHTSVINIGGRYFDHFLKLFDTNRSDYALKKRVACITDLDPVRKNIKEENGTWKSCLPLFLENDTKKYSYRAFSNKILHNKETIESENNQIRIFSQEKCESSTFEYDVILQNITNRNLIIDSMSNKPELEKLMELYEKDNPTEKLIENIRKGNFKDELSSCLPNMKYDPSWIKKHIIAGRYLKSINKGEAAQELAYVISNDLEKDNVTCPKYIKEAILWIKKV